MINLSLQTSDIDLPPGLPPEMIPCVSQSYRNRMVSAYQQMVREPLQDKYNNRYMSLATDYGFKKVLANPANKEPMKHLLTCMFEGQKDIADILDFILPDSPEEEYHHDIGSVYLSNNRPFYRKQRFKFIELPKFTKTLNQLKTGLDKWLHLMKHLHEMNSIPPGFEEPVFQEVFYLADIKNLTKGEKDMYRTSEQDKLDQQEMIKHAADEAEERGLEKGKLPFVKYLLNNTDHDDEKIADVAAVDVNFVKKVQAKMRTRMVVN